MSTSTILTGVGYVVGGYFGYPQLGAIIGGMVGGQIEANRMPDSKLDDLKAAKVSLGSPINLLFGHPRSGGNLAWVSDAIESGEEGGKGGSGPTTTNYVRHCLVIMSEDVCGPAARIWFGGKLAYNVLASADDETIEASVEDGLIEEVIYYNGDADQLPDPTYEAAIGVGYASAYRGRSTMMLKGIACGPSGQLPPITFEVAGKDAGTNVGVTVKYLEDFAPADYRLSPPEGASYGTIKVQSITDGGIATYSANGDVVVKTIPQGVDLARPGRGNGDRALTVFGTYNGGVCQVGIAGDGIPSNLIDIDDPMGYLGTEEIRFSTFNGDILIASSIEWTGVADNTIPGQEFAEALGYLGYIYIYTLGGEFIGKADIHEDMPQIDSVAMNDSRIWILGGGNIIGFDKVGFGNYESFIPPSGGGHRIFITNDGVLACANAIAQIHRYIDGAWELFTTMNDYAVDGVPVNLGTSTCDHVIYGKAAFAIRRKTFASPVPISLYRASPDDPNTIAFYQPSLMERVGAYAQVTPAVWHFFTKAIGGGYRRTAGGTYSVTSVTPYSGPPISGIYSNVTNVIQVTYTGQRYYGYIGDSGQPPGMYPSEHNATFYEYVEYPDIWAVDVYRKRVDVDVYQLTEPTLQEVVEALCLRADIPADRVDATDLATKNVHAMAVTQVSPTTSSLEMLMVVYKFYCTESGGRLIFKFYGDAPVRTIPFDEIGATFGDPPINPLPLQRGSELELPSMESARYANIDNDYQDGMESSDRLNASTQSASVSEYAIGLTPNEAKQLAVTNQQIRMAGLIRVGPVSVSPDNRDIEPGDSIVVTRQDGSTVQTFVQKLTFDRGVCTLEGVSEDTAAYTSDAVTANNYTNATVVRPPPETEFEILDIPLLSDETDAPHFHVVAKPERFPWSGYSFQRSPDDVSYSEIYQDNSIGIFGTCSTTLAQWTGANVVDNLSSVTVNVGLGQLSSITRIELITSRLNLAMVGNEMLQFQNAELITTGVYIISGFARYLGGTQWVGHGPNERFVLLRQSTLETVNLNLADYGITRYYKAVTLGRNPNTADSESFAPALVSMQPIAPANLRAIDLPNGDIFLRWVRRTRYQSNALRGIVPLGEASEEYTVQIYDGATLVRTINSSVQQATYTAAQQAADGIGSGSDMIVRVRQVGAVQGHPAEFTLDA